MSVPAGAYISHDATGQHVQQRPTNSPENVTDPDDSVRCSTFIIFLWHDKNGAVYTNRLFAPWLMFCKH